MSKGFGVIQRKIDELFRADPEGVFTVGDLCREIYSEVFRPKKKHRVAVIRAAKAVAKRHPGIHYWRAETRGGSWIFFHHDNVMSYAIARERGSWRWVTNYSNAKVKEKLLKDERSRKMIESGGSWWLHVEEWIAERDGDSARLQELKPLVEENARQWAARTAMLKQLLAKAGASGH